MPSRQPDTAGLLRYGGVGRGRAARDARGGTPAMQHPGASPPAEAAVQVGETTVAFVAGSLVEQDVAALLLSANNRLGAKPGRWSWSLEVERRAGPNYVQECRRI